MVHIEMRRAVWGLPQAGLLANKKGRSAITPHLRKTAFIFTPENEPLLFCNTLFWLLFQHTVAMRLRLSYCAHRLFRYFLFYGTLLFWTF